MGIGKFVFGDFSGETTFVSVRAKMMSHKTFEKWFAKNNADFGIVARFCLQTQKIDHCGII